MKLSACEPADASKWKREAVREYRLLRPNETVNIMDA
jgi:hypothetical protein